MKARNDEHQLIGTCTAKCCQPSDQTISELDATVNQMLGAIHTATHLQTYIQNGQRGVFNQVAAERWAVHYAKTAAHLANAGAR